MKKDWNDLTVRDLLSIKDIDGMQMATDAEKNLRVAAIVADKSYEELLDMSLNDVSEFVDACDFLQKAPKPRKARRHYVINGRKYKLLKNEMEMLTSQYVDFQAIYQDGFDKRPAELLSIMMVPDGHEYNDGYDKELVINDMYDFPVEEALGVCDFFMGRFVRSIAWTRMYFRWMMWWKRITTPRKDREMMRAVELELNLVMEELNSMFGSIVRGPFQT